MRWPRLLVLMWLLVRIDLVGDSWDPVIIGGYESEQTCRIEQKRSPWGSRVLCVRATTPPLLEPIPISIPTDDVVDRSRLPSK